MYKKGFTLIELLVVVAIIGMLSSVVLASLNTARGNARDARRVQDGRQVATAIELRYNVTNDYPAHGDSGCSTNYCLAHTAASLAPAYIPSIPADPLYNTTGTFPYRYCTTGVAFEVRVFSEKKNDYCHIRHGSNDPGSGCWMSNGVPTSGGGWCDG
jgi:prepilin-type N-terminal cleavage/methylation domain-containing protein